ncbi:hypothetical protein TWF970_006592 [Orbilia oligospora]|uniref:Uncharacterized protein n=1 Tax=Orbilia oligospora TaxID=2813651 RepID=A0A7C8VLI1_ORBOL|nr:hypothetical protein TWF970_006592 [Orbilia oligospora]
MSGSDWGLPKLQVVHLGNFGLAEEDQEEGGRHEESDSEEDRSNFPKDHEIAYHGLAMGY